MGDSLKEAKDEDLLGGPPLAPTESPLDLPQPIPTSMRQPKPRTAMMVGAGELATGESRAALASAMPIVEHGRSKSPEPGQHNRHCGPSTVAMPHSGAMLAEELVTLSRALPLTDHHVKRAPPAPGQSTTGKLNGGGPSKGKGGGAKGNTENASLTMSSKSIRTDEGDADAGGASGTTRGGMTPMNAHGFDDAERTRLDEERDADETRGRSSSGLQSRGSLSPMGARTA